MTGNINLPEMERFIEKVEEHPEEAKKAKKVEGEWSLDEGETQYKATLSYVQGQGDFTCELPPIMGGWGRAPDPVQYCLFGLGACYLSTFASAAVAQGVELDELKITVECKMDLHKQLGLSDENIIEQARFVVQARSNAPADQLRKVKEQADKRCPGVECLTRQIPLSTELI
jgi:uncharacterized OsmC-like protein